MNELGCLVNFEKLMNLTLNEPEVIFHIFSAMRFKFKSQLSPLRELPFIIFFCGLNRRPFMLSGSLDVAIGVCVCVEVKAICEPR